MSDQAPPAELQRREISLSTMLVVVALNQEAHAYGSTIEDLEAKTKLKGEEVMEAIYRLQFHGLLIAEYCQDGTAGPIGNRHRLDSRAKEMRIEIKTPKNRSTAISMYFEPPPKKD